MCFWHYTFLSASFFPASWWISHSKCFLLIFSFNEYLYALQLALWHSVFVTFFNWANIDSKFDVCLRFYCRLSMNIITIFKFLTFKYVWFKKYHHPNFACCGTDCSYVILTVGGSVVKEYNYSSSSTQMRSYSESERIM